MNAVAIATHGLTKAFPNGSVAVKDLDLAVEPGSVYGLIGRNGSGKTTALRLLLGMLHPNQGESRVLGWDFWQAPHWVREQVAYVSQTQRLPGGVTLEELGRCLKRINQRWDTNYARRLAELWGLSWTRAVGCLSDGEQRRAALLLAFAVRPKVLVLDEPASGFDLVARRELVDQILEAITQSDGCTVLLSTHTIGDLERIADHVGILEHGRLALSAKLEDLLNEVKRVQVIFEREDAPAQFAIPGTLQANRTGAVLNAIVRWRNGGELEALHNSTEMRVQVFPVGLEEIFLELFGGENHKGGESSSVQSNDALR